jgi:hypothetical protein
MYCESDTKLLGQEVGIARISKRNGGEDKEEVGKEWQTEECIQNRVCYIVSFLPSLSN